MAPTHTPAGALGGGRPGLAADGTRGLERELGASAVPPSAPTPRRNKGGGGTHRRTGSAGRDGAERARCLLIKPGCGRGARSTGVRSGRAPHLSAGLGLRSVSGRAQVSHARARQRRRFPAEHGAASEGRGPGGAAQGRSRGLAAGRRAAGAGAWTATLVTAAFAPACRA